MENLSKIYIYTAIKSSCKEFVKKDFIYGHFKIHGVVKLTGIQHYQSLSGKRKRQNSLRAESA